MVSPFKISIQVPNYKDDLHYFTFRMHEIPKNEACEYSTPSQLFVVSDIEGNFAPLFKLLVAGGVISQKMEWLYGSGHVVILGDCFDRGEEVTECLWLIYGLEEKAKRHGGHVHYILGNHEIMNMNGDWRYVHPRYAVGTVSLTDPPAALYYANDELWRWLQSKNVIERIGNYLFVHGGVSRELLDLRLSLSEINALARPYYSHKFPEFLSDNTLHTLFSADISPFWYRGYYNGVADKSLVKNTLKFYNSKHIITGHTMLETITFFFDGKVINVNTDHANNFSEGLMVMKNKFYRVFTNGEYHKIG
ncbi:metallophosphoesterase [Pseudoflavitalea sp. G-6-1-2]|uniref:metallophosphoesterase n=1 Tax=Pseudoflavitalea sp. G-6-1-2 TaxID=2728841 RepID=UPI00146AAA01|nr:metallophosphoesterase [Pseudoflavitalea sp. G-6-1-2]NML22965.1 metallophosphoesterase [Pseudoflavitalea sp. G-6-1-2]